MKKYSWIVSLLIALALAFVACPAPEEEEEEEEGEMEWTVIFDMANSELGTVTHEIQSLTAGKVTIGNDLPAGESSKIKPLVEAGEGDNHVIITAVKGPGAQAIALKYETVANWGAGIDLPNKAFGFQVGDKITITGEVLDINGGYVQANFKVGSEDSHGFKVTEDGEFEWEIELTASLLGEIRGGDPSAIRLDGRTGGQIVQINNIHIEGNRPTNITKLEAPVIAVTGTGVSWTAIEGAGGYEVYAGETKIATLASSATSINLNSLADLAPGTHSITVVAVGVAGSTSNSDKSNAVSYTKPEPPKMGITVAGAAKQVEVIAASGTEVNLLTGNGGYELTYGTAQYGAVYAYFEVDFGAGKSLQDYSKLTLDWKGIAGDIGYKQMYVFASSTAFTGSVSNTGAAASHNFNSGNTTEQEGTFYLSAPAVTGQKAFIAITIWAGASSGTPAVATKYEVKNIAFSAVVLQPVDSAAITLAAPVAGVPPQTTVDSAQFSGTVAWSPTITGDAFAISTAYTATITLTPKVPYTFTGVAANFFTVAEATTVNNAANSGVVTAVFPQTASSLLTSFDITIGGGGAGATTSINYNDIDNSVGGPIIAPIPGGYQYTYQNSSGGNYSLAKFSINLGTGKKLSDFASITLTFEGVAGDYGYKRMHLLAATQSDGLPTANNYTVANYQVTLDSSNYSNNSEAEGTTDPKNMTIELDPTKLSGQAVWNTNLLEIAIWGNMVDRTNTTSYKITNIVFVAKP